MMSQRQTARCHELDNQLRQAKQELENVHELIAERKEQHQLQLNDNAAIEAKIEANKEVCNLAC